jgi:hypothetical protein
MIETKEEDIEKEKSDNTQEQGEIPLITVFL